MGGRDGKGYSTDCHQCYSPPDGNLVYMRPQKVPISRTFTVIPWAWQGGMAKSILQPSSSDAISIAVHDFCLQSPFWD